MFPKNAKITIAMYKTTFYGQNGSHVYLYQYFIFFIHKKNICSLD